MCHERSLISLLTPDQCESRKLAIISCSLLSGYSRSKPGMTYSRGHVSSQCQPSLYWRLPYSPFLLYIPSSTRERARETTIELNSQGGLKIICRMGLLYPQLLISLLWLLVWGQIRMPISASRKPYVVYMGSHHQALNNIPADHHEFLASFVGGKKKAREVIFYTYTKHINGFAANLQEVEVAAISKSPLVVAVFPSEMHELHTTHSWEFLGLEKNGDVPADSIWRKARLGQGIILGSLDSGVWPESQSFNDAGMGPVPTKWKGACESGQSDPIRCNRKLIGVRLFNKAYVASWGQKPGDTDTVRDVDGHGTHTLTTAAGRSVADASLFGFGNGTAKGGAPGARVAAYKVCFGKGESRVCSDADILAAIDQAIEDGVDILTISIGGQSLDYLSNGIAVGSFHAVRNGITVVCSAGNSGPRSETVANVAPWILTVAASTIDREFSSYAVLGNGEQLKGQSLSTSSLPANQSFPLISSDDAPAFNSSSDDALVCLLGSLDPAKVKGKIVVCIEGDVSDVEKGQAVLLAGGVGVIISSDFDRGYDLPAAPHVIPALSVSYDDGEVLSEYIRSSTNPTASITKPLTVFGTNRAPFMASFSSRGPNPIDSVILKPDITAPGVSILAAYSEAAEPSGDSFDARRVKFNILSGTSMSCPHIAGVVALLKAIHPDWSPAAIKSAIMTTATAIDNQASSILDSSFDIATPFSYGSGHVRPNLSMDPGLVYDLTVDDHLNFLCAVVKDSRKLSVLTGEDVVCPQSLPRPENLNYPSITVPTLSASTTITRKLKNVGSPGTYKASVVPPDNISVTVSPDTLVFRNIGQEEAFNVTLRAETDADFGNFGWLIWSDGIHTVRSPIVVGFE